MLVEKTIAACKAKHIRTVLVGGGVAANQALRRMFDGIVETGITVLFPAKEYCMDNAAMIAAIAYHLRRGQP